MTRYSIYDPKRERYEVYVDFAGPAQPAPASGPVMDIQEALPQLPSSAALRSYSDVPVGILAQPAAATVSLWYIAMFGLLAWWLLKE